MVRLVGVGILDDPSAASFSLGGRDVREAVPYGRDEAPFAICTKMGGGNRYIHQSCARRIDKSGVFW